MSGRNTKTMECVTRQLKKNLATDDDAFGSGEQIFPEE